MTEPTDPHSPAPPSGDRSRERLRDERRHDTGAIVWGAILPAVGAWFFLDQTLGIRLPSVDWRELWPVILIVVGVVVIVQGMRRRTG